MSSSEHQSVAVVTGGASGIGQAVCLALSAEGYYVVAADIDDSVETTTTDILAKGGSSAALRFDVASPEEVSAAFATVGQTYGRLDVLVNCAGVTREVDFFSATPEDWDRILNINAKGTFLSMQAGAAAMKATGGRIVNIGALAGKGWSGASNIAYAASKGAVLAMTRIAAISLASFDITVNAVCPGITFTELLKGVTASRAEHAGVSVGEIEARMLSRIPLGRANTPHDVAGVVAFLASPAARNITGQSINVDGGVLFD